MSMKSQPDEMADDNQDDKPEAPPANDNTQEPKGKGKAPLTTRLQASSKAALNAITAPDSLPDSTPRHKTDVVAGPSNSSFQPWLQVEASRLREALFTTPTPWSQLLDFNPDFASLSREHLRLHFGTADVAAARNIWLQQWSDVLESYTEHVWGHLGPLAADARREVQLQLAQDDDDDGPALRRLRMVLAHLRPSRL
ncbi:hypothetical protein CDD80_4789 [Ophiocordyceps camponoti-rufipedis]|uniref:Uncharacterized protein n=1 Tax=Ophiocordyceps camponoti-rufipedis TaxID=2004952 RepID=A0A2C5ZC36_9HYPO|nr:hypothetical protein CDD80_4789 [Ophiocordyceps camponoti-rufipedis]